MKYDNESIEKRRNRAEKIRKLIFIIIIIMLYNTILLCVSYINNVSFPGFFGYKAYSITTDSMEPTLSIGDIVILKKQDEDKIKQGDIITYFQKGEMITHRIIEIKTTDGKHQYITKGDNNTLEDLENIEYEQIEGVKVIKIPLLGNIISFLKDEVIVLIIILIILVFYFYKVVKTEKKEERRKKKEIEDKRFKQKENNNL